MIFTTPPSLSESISSADTSSLTNPSPSAYFLTSTACAGVNPDEVISSNSVRAARELYYDQLIVGERHHHKGDRICLQVDDYSKISKSLVWV